MRILHYRGEGGDIMPVATLQIWQGISFVSIPFLMCSNIYLITKLIFFKMRIIMMFSYETEWGRGNIHACSYYIIAARYLFCIFAICLICSNIYLKKKTTFNVYFFFISVNVNYLIISPIECMILGSF